MGGAAVSKVPLQHFDFYQYYTGARPGETHRVVGPGCITLFGGDLANNLSGPAAARAAERIRPTAWPRCPVRCALLRRLRHGGSQ